MPQLQRTLSHLVGVKFTMVPYAPGTGTRPPELTTQRVCRRDAWVDVERRPTWMWIPRDVGYAKYLSIFSYCLFIYIYIH